MDADLQPIYERVMSAARPEDVFAEMNLVLPRRLLEKHLFPELSEYRAVLESSQYSNPDDQSSAEAAQTRFEQLYTQALASAEKGRYNVDGFSPQPLRQSGRAIIVDGVTYNIEGEYWSGERCALHRARFAVLGGTASALVKLANTSDDNLLISNEIRILDNLHATVGGKELGQWRFLPFVYGRFSAGKRLGTVERFFDGITLVDIRNNALHRSGLDQRHMVWVLDRVLNLLGYVHQQGVIHGRISPSRILIRPSNHNAIVTGWSRAVYQPATTGEVIVSSHDVFTAPEVVQGGGLGPWTDVYSLGKTMIWLLGGDPHTNAMPVEVEVKIQRFLLNMVRQNPRARPRDAWQLYRAQNALKDSLWERQFRHLELA